MSSRADLIRDIRKVGIVKVRLELTFIFMFWRRGHFFLMHSFSTVYFWQLFCEIFIYLVLGEFISIPDMVYLKSDNTCKLSAVLLKQNKMILNH